MCTNYNQVIHDIGLQGTMYNQISAMKLSHVLAQKSSKPNVDVDSYSKMINNQLFLSNTSGDTLTSHMSPSSYFSNSNQRISRKLLNLVLLIKIK